MRAHEQILNELLKEHGLEAKLEFKDEMGMSKDAKGLAMRKSLRRASAVMVQDYVFF